MKTALRRLSAAAPAFALAACMLTGGDSLVTPGGAEDFPNTVTTLGRIAVGDISAGTQWEQAQDIQLPDMPDLGGLDSLQIDPPSAAPKRAALAKTAATADTLDLSLWQIDQSPSRYLEAYFFGRIYAYSLDSTAAYVRRDTVEALYLGDRSAIGASSGISGVITEIQADPGRYLLPLDYRGAMQYAAGNGTPGIRKTYRLRNTDSRGDLDLAEYTTLTPQPNGGSLSRRVKIYGPEGTFRLPDPVPEEFELLRRGQAGDTLEWTLVRDADWDRRLWTLHDSGVVDLYLYVRNPTAAPHEFSRMRAYVRAGFRRTSEGDSLQQLAYQEQRWLRNGRITTFVMQGIPPGSIPAPGDLTRMTVDTIFSAGDSAIRYTASYDLRTGSAPYRMEEHAMLGYNVSKYWRKGPVFHVTSTFSPATPVPMGQGPFEGGMLSIAAYANGDTVRTEGTITRDSLNLTVRQVRKGVSASFDVVLDAAGKLLRPPVPVTLPDASATARRAAKP